MGNQGGFRYAGSVRSGTVKLCVLYTSGTETDWPDRLDVATGDFEYFGDNRRPGSQLLATPRAGNLLLQSTFDRANAGWDERSTVPPYLLFSKAGRGRDVVFRGLLAPGSPRLSPEEELVAVWRTTAGARFQNYRAHFTVLDVPIVNRAWITEILAGDLLGANCPEVWRAWVRGTFVALEAPRSRTIRSRQEQLPSSIDGLRMLEEIRSHFASRPHAFEHFAADLWLMSDSRIVSIDVTRPSRDGGRDAIGQMQIGLPSDPIAIDFALEAKLYGPGNSVGVREMSRLISRIRARQFGVLVTTSFVAPQAYQEIRDDGHPIVIISGVDILHILSQVGIRTTEAVRGYLLRNHPLSAAPAVDLTELPIDIAATDLDPAAVATVPLFDPAVAQPS